MPVSQETAAEYHFSGFTLPTYTMVPDQVFDELLPQLTGNELKVLLYIIRRTFGFRKDADAISLDQFVHGITKRDGSVLDTGAGVSKSGAQAAIKALVAKGIVEAVAQEDENGGDAPTIYRLCFVGVPKSDNGGIRNKQPRLSKTDKTPYQNLVHLPK